MEVIKTDIEGVVIIEPRISRMLEDISLRVFRSENLTRR